MNLPKHWYVIARSPEIKKNKILSLTRFGQRLVLWRDIQGALTIMDDRCPHRSAQLSLGELKNGKLACPFHGFQFDAVGTCQWVPELNRAAPKLSVKTYQNREKDGWVWMWWGDGEPADKMPAWFTEVDDTFCTAYMKASWKTHFSRSVENQLDYAHLPFVHRNSIGKYATPIQRYPEFKMDEERIKWFFPRADGLEPQSFIEFRFPNVWINRISEKYSITLAFVPVDDQHTDLYLKSYRKFANIPGLNRVINFLMLRRTRGILNEDRQVVTSQEPIDVRLATEEVLFPSDQAVRHFRKWLG